MPQGERRETVLQGARRQYIVLSGRKGEFRLDELPQGECREIVYLGGESRGEIVLSGRMGSSGSKRHRRASTGRLFCVGEGGDGILFWAGKGEFGIEELPQGERRETVLRGGGMGDGEAAGDWSEREKGEFGLGDLPQGERREIVLHVVRRQGIVLSGGRGSSGSTSCRRVSAEKLFCVGKGAGGGGRILL